MDQRPATNEELYPQDPENCEEWCTRAELRDWGYSNAGIDQLFGPETTGPGGVTGWARAHVDHVEDTVVAPAIRLVREGFTDAEAATDVLSRALM
ncbi:hypothetical protein ACFVKB_39195 [Rhodococcus sp. NPDC127530]|uniref:hypothetical protein n=1 Tax=unclassified Rhodococcus (in: high G+C Gram-positive bacteria) TaxID=192944 RepID=UPI00362DEAC1